MCICDYVFCERSQEQAKKPYEGKTITALVTRVIDGDTVEVMVNFRKYHCCSAPHLLRIRLLGVDTPELHPKREKMGNDEMKIREEKRKATISWRETQRLLLHRVVTIECDKYDSFGRMLGTIYEGSLCWRVNMTKHLIDNGYGVERNK